MGGRSHHSSPFIWKSGLHYSTLTTTGKGGEATPTATTPARHTDVRGWQKVLGSLK